MSPEHFYTLCVGYTNKKLDGGYFNMVTPNFCGVGNQAHKYWVSDIKITGYEEDPSFVYNNFGANFTILTPGGSSDFSEGKMFYFVGEWNEADFKVDPGYWTDYNGQTIMPHGEGDLQLEPGQAVLLSTDGGDEEYVQMFVTAGEVITAETQVPLNDGEFTSVGNPYPVGIWVSDITITGYEEDQSFIYNNYGANFTILDKGGSSDFTKDKMFYFVGEWNEADFKVDPGYWTDYNGQTIIPHGEGDIQLQPGQGVLLSTDGGDGVEYPKYLIFPELKIN